MRWSISYQVRAILLVALLTSAAIAVTVWVTARSTVTQLSNSVDSQRDDVDAIAQQIKQYGVVHGVWVGVASLTLQLERSTSQRIKLTTESGQVVVDTDTLHGRAARPPSSLSPVAIVPRPELDLTGADVKSGHAETLDAIQSYRQNVRMAACLTEHGVPFATAAPVDGISPIDYDSRAAGRVGCVTQTPTEQETAADARAVTACTSASKLDPADPATASGKFPLPGADAAALSVQAQGCLSQVFQDRTAADDAVTLLLYVGFRGSPSLHVQGRRLLAVSVPIVLLAIVCGILLGRHVLRPVGAVIGASRLLEAGQRTARVPERGHDEMAALARAFNRMADGVQHSEEQQRRMVADIAHELRTPLANIRGYLEALKDGVLAPSAEIFESLHEEALLQQRTIDDLHDLALADQHRLIDRRVRTDLGELARTARAAHAARADAAGVALAERVESGLYVDADPDRLRQAIGNLVTNALRATPPGGRITIAAGPAGRRHVRITVTDTGSGIAAEDLPHIFDRFWRADPARARRTGGSGLGLAITREIVHGHGGAIEVSSTPGAGTTMTITLPSVGG